MAEVKRTPRRTSSKRPARLMRFKDTRIAYKFVFDLGWPVEPIDAARSLLGTDLAMAAVGLLPGEVFVASRFSKVDRGTRLLADIAEFQETEFSLRRVSSFALRHPRFLVALIRSLASSRARREASPEPADGSDIDLRAEQADLRRLVHELPIMQQVAISMDHRRFAPPYLAQLPFCRVELQPLHCESGAATSSLDVHLLIHRSGVCVLTLWWQDELVRTTDELIPMTTAVGRSFDRIEVVESVVTAPARLNRWGLDAPAATSVHSGVKWLTYEAEEGMHLDDLAAMYMDAVRVGVAGSPRAARRRGDRDAGWFCYPVVFVNTTRRRALDSISAGTAKELAGLTGRHTQWRELRPSAVKDFLPRDWSLRRDLAVWIAAGSLTVVDGSGRRDLSTADDLEWSGAADHMLVRFGQVRVVNEMLMRVPGHLRAVHRAADQLMLASNELVGRGVVTWGTLAEMIEHADKCLGVEDLLAAARERLQLASEVANAELAESRTRRDLVLQVATATAAVVLGLPAINDAVRLLGTVRTADEGPARALATASQLAREHPAALTGGVWLVLVIALACLMWWSLRSTGRRLPPLGRRSLPRFSGRMPYRWPDPPLGIEFVDRSAEAALGRSDSVDPPQDP